MFKRPIHRRGPLASTLIFVVTLTMTLLLIAFFQIDIGSYKKQLAAQLERTLNKPVRLGDAELTYQGGIALDFRNLKIGDDNSFSLHIPQLTATLNPFGLLRGEIIIEQILLEYPSFKVQLPLTLAKSTLDLDRWGLKTLQVRKGSLTVLPTGRETKPLRVENFNMVIHGLGQGRVSQLTSTATLFQHNRNAEFKSHIELTRQNHGQPWRQGTLSGNLSFNNLRRQTLGNLKIGNLPNIFNLAIDLKGTPSEGVDLQATLKNSQTAESIVSLLANWQSTPENDQVRNLKLGLAGIPLTGDLELNYSGTEPRMTGNLDLGHTDLRTLMSASGEQSTTEFNGQLVKLFMAFNGPLHATDENPFSPLQNAVLQIENLNIPAQNFGLQKTNLNLELTDGQLTEISSWGEVAGTPFTVMGSTGRLNSKEVAIDLQIDAEADLQKVKAHLKTPFWQRQNLSGLVPMQLNLQGPLNNIALKFTSNLDQSQLSVGKLLLKEAEHPLRLAINGQLKQNQFVLRNAELNLGESQLRTEGNIFFNDQSWSGTLFVPEFETGQLQRISPIFSYFKIEGLIQGQIEIGSIKGIAGQMKVNAAGSHLTSVIGDLNQVNGTVILSRNGLDLGQLKAKIGKSDVRISGAMTNWRSPLLSLHVTGEAVRAQDLVFTNRKMMLQDVDGRLLISAGGILFDNISVTVENRTHAVVKGQMRSYRHPQTELDVTADDAEILDIIRLFNGPAHTSAPPKAGPSPTLKINAHLTKGTLDGLPIKDARGTIYDKDHVFTVEPLSFQAGQGTAYGRVEFERDRNSLLKLSGRVENLDFEPLYKNFFSGDSILKGSLSGDFYVEGENKDSGFWKTSQGGGHFEVTNGTLKKLHGLAQIFSILNVTQILTLNLPDMDKEGLPFSQLSISPRLDKGIYYVKDMQVVSPAINISAVGQLDSLKENVDFTVGIKPLRTVDILLEKIPLVGWILTGKEKALITALFSVKGPINDSRVEAIPVSTVSSTVLGIIGRTLTLPAKIIKDTGTLLTTPRRPKDDPAPQEKDGQN